MLANCCTKQQALLNFQTMIWSATGNNKADENNEEGWTLLPDGSVLTVDTNNLADLTHSERYLSSLGGWISAGSTIAKLDDTNADGTGHEIGPAVLRPNGTVFAVGATGFTSIYHPPGNPNQTGRWEPGPTFPSIPGQGQFVTADGPAALLPDGNVLVAASPASGSSPTHFFEFDGNSLTQVSEPPNASSEPSFVGNLLVLPTGQVLLTDLSGDIEIYTPAGRPKISWRPKIEEGPRTVTRGHSYRIYGRLFNGRSQADGYGDDYQGSTDYPLVRITNLITGHVFYCRTFSPSSISVANAGRVYTNFAVPSGMEPGPSRIEVIANGIPSRPVAATVF
jgi:hypothetical protein